MVNFKLAYLRCIRRGTRLSTAVLFIALLQATFVITNSAIPLVESQSVEQQMSGLTQSEKWFSINLGDPSQLGRADKNEFATAKLEILGASNPFHFLTYRPISDNTEGRFQLVGTNRLAEQVELTSGHIPDKCDESLCEVLLVNSDQINLNTTKFEIVGTAKLNSDSPMHPSLDTSSPWLVSSDLLGVAQSSMFSGFPGTETWSSEITFDQIKKVGLANFLAQTNQIVNELSQASGRMQLIAPLAILDRTQTQIQVMLNRVLSLELNLCLVGSFGIFLLSRSGRKSHLEFIKSANQIQPSLISKSRITLSVAVFIGALGSVIGILTGWFGASLLVKSFIFPQFDWLSILVILSSSIMLIFCGLSNSRLSISLSSMSTILIWLTFIYVNELKPQLALIAIVASAVSIFVTILVSRKLKNTFIRNTYLGNQNWIVSIVATGAFLVSIVISGMTYLHSLEVNAVDSAIYNSPTQTRIKMGGDAQVLQFNTLEDYKQISNDAQAFPIRKIQTTFKPSALAAIPVQLMGIDSKLWQNVPEIKHQTGFDLRTSEALLSQSRIEFGIPVPDNISMQVKVAGLDENTFLSAWVLNKQSEAILVNLSDTGEGFSASLPLNSDRILGFQISENPDFTARREHAVGEGKNSLPVPSGTINIDSLLLDQKPFTDAFKIVGDYSMINGPTYFSLVQPPSIITAIVDSATARDAIDNKVQLQITPDNSVVLTVAGIARNLPTVPMQFALVDSEPLTQLLASKNPELLRIPEVWVTGDIVDTPEAKRKITGLTLISQKQLIAGNLSPVNTVWTKRSFAMMEVSAILMFLALIVFATRNIYMNSEMFGWKASGKKLSSMYKLLTMHITLTIGLALLASLFTTIILLPNYISNLAFDLKGDLAYPPVITQWNLDYVLLTILGLIVLSLAALTIASKSLEKIAEAKK